MRLAAFGTVVLGLAFLGACSDDGGSPSSSASPDSGVRIVDDTGVFVLDAGLTDAEPVDGGTVDTGVLDCSGNPFNCAPMQLFDDECRCLADCEGDLEWNPNTSMCEEPFAGMCGEDTDCPGPDDVCLNRGQTFTACMNEPTCECFIACDPFTDPFQAGCPAQGDGNPQACVHLINAELNADAICLDRGTGLEQGEVCTPGGTQCDRLDNYFCVPQTDTSTAGVCRRLCDTAGDEAFCSSFAAANHRCEAANVPGFETLGICGPTPLPLTSIGQACVSNDQCDNVCSPQLGGSPPQGACTQDCRYPRSCAEGASCITFLDEMNPDIRSVCMVDCTSTDMVGDAECRARNLDWVCRDLLRNGITPPLCFPRCEVFGCTVANTVCNPATGRCE